MNNKIVYVTTKEVREIKEKAIQDKDVFLAEIKGAEIETEEEYVKAMANAFFFPNNFHSMKMGWFRDYICDLMWIEQKEIIVVIRDYELMLVNETKTKEIIMDDFEEIILPWWEGEVVGHMVGVGPRKFSIYLEKN